MVRCVDLPRTSRLQAGYTDPARQTPWCIAVSVLHCIELHCPALSCTILHWIALHRTLLHSSVVSAVHGLDKLTVTRQYLYLVKYRFSRRNKYCHFLGVILCPGWNHPCICWFIYNIQGKSKGKKEEIGAKFYLVVNALLSGQKKIVRTKKLSGQKKCLDKKIVRTKKLSGQKNCPDKKIVWTENCSDKKNFGQKNCPDKKKFWTKKLSGILFLSRLSMPLVFLVFTFFLSIWPLICCLEYLLSIFLSDNWTTAWYLFQKYLTTS